LRYHHAMLPSLFVASSSRHIDTARAIKTVLADVANVTVWDEPDAGFRINESIFGGLLSATEQFDFAVFVFEADDLATIRRLGGPKTSAVVRDNVIFEFGLFVGSLGRSRAYWISPTGGAAPTLPTDLAGIVHLRFNRPGRNGTGALERALTDAAQKLSADIQKLGRRADRPLEELVAARVLCASSKEYDAPQFDKDRKEIRRNFPKKSLIAREGITAKGLYELMSGGRWDIVHLASYVDVANGDVILPEMGDKGRRSMRNRILANGLVDLVKGCGARLVVVPTCDSIALAIKLAPFTNVIAGHKSIEAVAALDWAKVFYWNLARGIPLRDSYDSAQRQADCGLALLSKREFRLVFDSEAS
jgi:hypothetical protein